MKILATFDLDTIRKLLPQKGKIVTNGFWVRKSPRIVNLLLNPRCKLCGIEGSIVRLENLNNENPHLNMYAILNDGKHVLMCSNHRIPECYGGLSDLDNLRTLCIECNDSLDSRG